MRVRCSDQAAWEPVLSYAATSASLITPALEARYPFQAALAQGAPGKLPPSQQGLELGRKGILVTAFGANPDGRGTVLRLWEYAGNSGPCKIRLPSGLNVTSIQPLDLRGRPIGQPIAVKRRSFTVNLAAFAPASLLLGEPD